MIRLIEQEDLLKTSRIKKGTEQRAGPHKKIHCFEAINARQVPYLYKRQEELLDFDNSEQALGHES